MKNSVKTDFKNVDITSGFWAARQKINRETTIYSVENRFEETGRFEAFEFGWHEGCMLPKPHFFWDSDIAKWIESAAYIIEKEPDEELESRIDDIVELIEQHQQPDGYFNIYFTVVAPGKAFSDRDCHELYCAGHLIEAAVAYYNATGKDKFLNLMKKYVECIIKVFTIEKSAEFSSPGHEEIELALIRLYRLTCDKKYLDLSLFFLNERGKDKWGDDKWCKDDYCQGHLPVRQQRTACGHAVRACYLYSGMADAAYETDDNGLLEACLALFDDITKKKMYITGGIGSSSVGEAFTLPYDLPNDIAYAETCAAISLAMFADRMKDIKLDSRYADIFERVMYNGFLSGVSLDGKSFFYENPLEINMIKHNRNSSVKHNPERYPITRRKEVFDCSCCPPNVTRFIASIGSSVFSYNENSVFIHQFMSCSAVIGEGENACEVNMETLYPVNGDISVNIAGAKGKKLFIRIPGWCGKYSISKEYTCENGYAVIDVSENMLDINVSFEMSPVFMTARPEVIDDCTKAALMYGPVVYCMEKADNDFELKDALVKTSCAPSVEYDSYFGCNVITFDASIIDKSCFNGLYAPLSSLKRTAVRAKFIPYFGFANRAEGDMLVWVNTEK